MQKFRHGDPAHVFLDGFFRRSMARGPRLHLKAATSAEGVMGLPDRRLLISGTEAMSFVMLLRAKLDAVLVGPGTVAVDLPGLDLRPSKGAPLFERTKPSEGRDLFCESLLRHAARLHGEGALEYQPRRVFLLGRPFPGSDRFLHKQERLCEMTGKPPAYLVLEEHLSSWPGVQAKAVLPGMSEGGFARDLRAALGELGLNEVLVEGGPGLFQALEEGDRFYHLHSERKLAELTDASGDAKRLPGFFGDFPESARFDLGTDRLVVHEL